MVYPRKNPHAYTTSDVDKHVDNVDNFSGKVSFPQYSARLRPP